MEIASVALAIVTEYARSQDLNLGRAFLFSGRVGPKFLLLFHFFGIAHG